MTQQQALDAGQTNVGEIVRSLPQSFSGGQNPGVAGGGDQGSSNENVNSASTINLRGLGADATLTLINGHRVAYDSVGQAVDLSQVPLVAFDRIEIVADGASALYGSDAVGGVANIILKPDYDGIAATARVGGSTDGGNLEQEYDLIGGKRWTSGGFLIAGDLTHSTAITADDRSYTRSLQASDTLVPSITQQSAVITGHQELTRNLKLSVDAIYDHRSSLTRFPSTTTRPFNVDGSTSHPRTQAFSISSRLDLDLGAGWSADLSGTYGTDRSHGISRLYAAGVQYLATDYRYDNRLGTAELGVEGPLFTLPGGAARLAAGGGYRSNGLTAKLGRLNGPVETISSETNHDRTSYYGFAELYLPIISPRNDVTAIHSLSVDGAIRYEDYPGTARLATPKLGVVYAPTADLDIKGSWGKSLKTPTLYQQYQAQSATLLDASIFGASSLPPGATTILLSGGNRALKPEKATSWSTTLDLHPSALPGADLELSYFHIDYRNRITEPLRSIAGALGNPLYAQIIDFDPTAAQQQDVLANTPGGLTNFSSGPYDPTNVVAIVDDRMRNAERQVIHGVDIAASYDLRTGANSHLTATLSASYLQSRQQLTSQLAPETLAGTIFHPPHWRTRTGFIWEGGPLTLTSYISTIGPVRDTRYTPAPRVGGMTTLDLAARYRAPRGSALGGFDIILSVNNAFNDKPAIIRNTAPYDPTYDSTNYSVVGRFISLTLSRSL